MPESEAHDLLVSRGWSDEAATLMSHNQDQDAVNSILSRLTDAIKRFHPKPETHKANISESLRWSVWERDNFTCQLCGSRRYLSVDHITPESKGGTLEIGNLQTLCRSCNSKKGAR